MTDRQASKVDIVFFALAAGLFGWALYQQFGAGDHSHVATELVFVAAAMTCISARAFVASRARRSVLNGCAVAALLAFLIVRAH